jgi:hypothetical protein
MRALFSIPLVCAIATMSLAALSRGQAQDTILTDQVVELKESVSSNGFVHPGISCNAETLSIMREKVKSGVSPWVDYFEGMRRTRYADLKRKPARVEQILNDGGIGGFAHDAQLAWTQTILYVVTGNEEYRKLPVEIIKWYGSRTEKSFFPQYFSDSHIKIGKYVYTMCSAVDILRATAPKDKSLEVTQEMVDALQKYCMLPIRKTCIERNEYFMNQHSYAIMGYLASTILGDEVDDYKQAVEWTTVNTTSPNQGRNGSIKGQIRLVTRNDKTGEAVEPNLQLVEMGRDMPHAEGNLTNLLMMSKTIEFQKTKVDPIAGTVTDKPNGVSPIHFLDDRLPKGLALYAKFNLGYGLPWVPTYSETDPKHPDYLARYDSISPRGRGSGVGASSYYYYKGIGLDLESGPYRYIKLGFDGSAAALESTRTGAYLDSVHNYGFDFWIGLPATSSDVAPDPEKAKRALALVLPKLEKKIDSGSSQIQQIESQFVDLSAHAQPGDIYPGSSKDSPLKVMQDPDSTGYVRMAVDQTPRTMVLRSRFPSGSLLRVRSKSIVKLSFYRDEDFSLRGCLQELYVPDTKGEWRNVIADFEGSGITYIQATPLAGSAIVDFDRVETDKAAPRAISFADAKAALSIPSFVGATIQQTISATGGREKLTYTATNLPVGAELDPATGLFSWTPNADQVADHVIYIVAQDNETIRAIKVDIRVARDLQAALQNVAKAHDSALQYTSTTEQAFQAAIKSNDLATLKQAVDGLKLLSPRLPDGTLDYRVASSPPDRGVDRLADNDPFTFGGTWGFDKNVTLDFGNRFKVKSEAFRFQSRDGHPSRMAGAVVYGSNDREQWTLLTEGRVTTSSDMVTLKVAMPEQNKPYRYLRLFAPASSGSIFELAEFRIIGERIEDYSPDFCSAYIKGFEDGTFRPDQNLTKAEAVSSLANLVDDYTDRGVYSCAFTDVAKDAPYYDAVAYMSNKGVGNGWSQPVKYVTTNSQKLFNPQAPISRGELAGIMSRMQWLKDDKAPALKDVTTDTPDAAEIRRVVREGWLTVDESGLFRPSAPITRAEFVVAVNRMIKRPDAPTTSAPAFSDVPASHWAYNDIMKAATTYPDASTRQER